MYVAETETVSSRDWGLFLIQGIAAVVLGLLLVTSPGATTVVLVALLGAYWLVAGIVSIARIFTGANRAHWGWSLAVGILGIAAGLIVLRHPLYSGFLAPTLLILILAIDALIMGVINIGRSITGDGATYAVAGIIDLIFSLILFSAPLFAASVLPVVIGVFAILGGVALIVYAFGVRGAREEEERVEERRAA